MSSIPTWQDRFEVENGYEPLGFSGLHQQAEIADLRAALESRPEEADLWAEIYRLRAAVEGPDGYATWQDAAVAERIRRGKAEAALANAEKDVENLRQLILTVMSTSELTDAQLVELKSACELVMKESEK